MIRFACKACGGQIEMRGDGGWVGLCEQFVCPTCKTTIYHVFEEADVVVDEEADARWIIISFTEPIYAEAPPPSPPAGERSAP
jgi:hypothetical protein